MTLRPHRVSSFLAALSLLTAGACARRPQSAAYVPGPDGGAPRRGGHVVFVREEDPDYLDPALSYGTYSASVTEAIYHTLLDYAHEPGPGGARLEPDLAASLPEIRGQMAVCYGLAWPLRRQLRSSFKSRKDRRLPKSSRRGR